ncbi:MAG: hypothetical protein WAK93_08875 [Solirubrobacteraceae bacterium]
MPDDCGQERLASGAQGLIHATDVELKLAPSAQRFRRLAEEAVREQETPVANLAALLEAEMAERAERKQKRRLIDARFTTDQAAGEDFRFSDPPRSRRRGSITATR